MLSKQNRLNRDSVAEIFKKGKSFSSDNFILKITPIEQKESAFAFVVQSKTTKKAVERNKLKRRARSVVRNILNSIKNNIGVIVFLKKSSIDMTYKEMNEELANLFKKARILK